MNKHHVCLNALPKTVAGVSPACWGLRLWEAPGIWGGGGEDWWSWPPLRPVQGRLAQHCRILSASSLTGVPKECLGQSEGLGRGSFHM